jgi:ribonuclease HI
MKNDLFEEGQRQRGGEMTLFVDGASRGNPGPSGVGVVLYDGGRRVLCSFGRYIGETTNNVAEYTALLYGLKEALTQQAASLKVRTDSELLARQIQGRYKVKEPHLKVLHDQVHHLIPVFNSFSIHHIPREKNREADRLANRAIDEMKL